MSFHCILIAMADLSAQRQVSHMFNAIAKWYDRGNRILSFGRDQKWRKMLIKYLPEGKDLRLLDLATGTCDQLLTLMETEKITKAVGIDLAEEMLAIGKQKAAASKYADQIELKLVSALDIPAPDASFDCITISFGIRNVQGNCLKEIFRLLSPGGRTIILEFSLPGNRIVRFFHLLYLRKILPRIGGWLSKEKSAYRYLNQTIETYPYGKAFLSLMEKEGFVKLKALPLTFGIATLYIGDKP